MNTDKELMQQALDALGWTDEWRPKGLREEAITALRERLAQPEQEQEPVAIVHRNEYNEYRLEPHDNFDIKSIPFNIDVLLFKSPQRTWVGLTIGEIQDLIQFKEHSPFALAEDIEAKLKEKNT